MPKYKALTVNLREDQYSEIEKVALQRFEGKMARTLRFMVDQWFKWEKKRLIKKMRREHERSS